jgi:hypothetical protein
VNGLMTPWERWKAGELPVTGEDDRRFAEYDAASFRAPASEDAWQDFGAQLGPVAEYDAASRCPTAAKWGCCDGSGVSGALTARAA